MKLLLEEKRRILVSLEHQAASWDSIANAKDVEGMTETIAEGLSAYAKSQAAVYRGILKRFQQTWKMLPALTSDSGVLTDINDVNGSKGDENGDNDDADIDSSPETPVIYGPLSAEEEDHYFIDD